MIQPALTQLAHPIGREQLELYWFGDLDAEATERLETHLFECEVCAARAERLALELTELERGIEGLPKAHMTRAEVAALNRGVVERLPPTGAHEMHVQRGAIHVFEVSLAEESRRGLERLEVEYLSPASEEPVFHIDDVPVPAAGEPIYLACHGHVLAMHGSTATVRVLGTRAGERVTVYESAIHFV